MFFSIIYFLFKKALSSTSFAIFNILDLHKNFKYCQMEFKYAG